MASSWSAADRSWPIERADQPSELPDILRGLRARSLKPVTLTELLG